jgi:hypothetical protein
MIIQRYDRGIVDGNNLDDTGGNNEILSMKRFIQAASRMPGSKIGNISIYCFLTIVFGK